MFESQKLVTVAFAKRRFLCASCLSGLAKAASTRVPNSRTYLGRVIATGEGLLLSFFGIFRYKTGKDVDLLDALRLSTWPLPASQVVQMPTPRDPLSTRSRSRTMSEKLPLFTILEDSKENPNSVVGIDPMTTSLPASGSRKNNRRGLAFLPLSTSAVDDANREPDVPEPAAKEYGIRTRAKKSGKNKTSGGDEEDQQHGVVALPDDETSEESSWRSSPPSDSSSSVAATAASAATAAAEIPRKNQRLNYPKFGGTLAASGVVPSSSLTTTVSKKTLTKQEARQALLENQMYSLCQKKEEPPPPPPPPKVEEKMEAPVPLASILPPQESSLYQKKEDLPPQQQQQPQVEEKMEAPVSLAPILSPQESSSEASADTQRRGKETQLMLQRFKKFEDLEHEFASSSSSSAADGAASGLLLEASGLFLFGTQESLVVDKKEGKKGGGVVLGEDEEHSIHQVIHHTFSLIHLMLQALELLILKAILVMMKNKNKR